MLIKKIKDFDKGDKKIRKEIIKSIFLDYGIEYCGIAPVKFDNELGKILNDRLEKNYLSGMEESDIKKRLDATLIMNDAKSIIVAAFPYYCGENEDSNISMYCRGYDYHIVAKKIMESISEKIVNEFSNLEKNPMDIKTEIFVDNGPLVDRHLAYISGIGFWGLNGSIITEKYGSYVFIGYIVTNLDIEKDEPLEKTCLKCKRCIKNCPGNALLENYSMNAKKCLSYITQKKGILTENEIDIIKKSGSIFGCDVCQNVCPHNKDIEVTNIEELKNNLINKLTLSELENISNREFKRRYCDRAFSWRGKGILVRNLEIMEGKNGKK